MPSIDTYRKQAKLLVRWHRERIYSVGELVRKLDRFRALSDADVLAMPMPLTLAQEVIAVGAGYSDWEELRVAARRDEPAGQPAPKPPVLANVTPILFVRDVAASAAWYGRLGFRTDFLHGNPPFYGAVSRDGVCLHLRLVEHPNFAELAGRESSLILASVEVDDVKALFDEFSVARADFAQRLTRQPWGGLEFQVRDPDGNTMSFVQYLDAPDGQS